MIVYMFCLDVLQSLIINSFFSRKCSVYKILRQFSFYHYIILSPTTYLEVEMYCWWIQDRKYTLESHVCTITLMDKSV